MFMEKNGFSVVCFFFWTLISNPLIQYVSSWSKLFSHRAFPGAQDESTPGDCNCFSNGFRASWSTSDSKWSTGAPQVLLPLVLECIVSTGAFRHWGRVKNVLKHICTRALLVYNWEQIVLALVCTYIWQYIWAGGKIPQTWKSHTEHSIYAHYSTYLLQLAQRPSSSTWSKYTGKNCRTISWINYHCIYRIPIDLREFLHPCAGHL